METAFTIILLVLVLLVYWANRNNRINKWFAISLFICWIGVFKEALLFNVIPYLEKLLHNDTLSAGFVPVYAVMTWALYSFAMPSMVVFALYFCNFDLAHPKLMRAAKGLIYLPATVLSFYFPPLLFRYYQLHDRAFGVVYSGYALCLGAVFTCLLVLGVRREKPGTARMQKEYLFWATLVPVLYWLLSASIPFLFQISSLDKLWQGNVFILLACTVGFIVLAFRDGFMGLRLTSETYNWNSDMSIINKGAQYTDHMLKNQTAKMEWCIENLNAHYAGAQGVRPEELAILSRSISTLKNFTDRIKKQSEIICLSEGIHNLKGMIESAIPPCAVPIRVELSDDLFFVCDRTHMTEALLNILSNAVEATRDFGTIEVSGGYTGSGRFYLLRVSDHGIGIEDENLKRIFAPYFTTKNTERNFGLGLSYCKNVVEKHGGSIRAERTPGGGTTVTIALPARRVAVGETEGAGNTTWIKK